jgi:hypothetical protein
MERPSKAMRESHVLAEYNRQLALREAGGKRQASRGALGGVDRDIRREIWLLVVESQKLSFTDTMQLLTGKDKGEESGSMLGPRREQFPLTDLSDMLSIKPGPWKRWFFTDMPEMVRDIGREVEPNRWEVDLPSWIEATASTAAAEEAHGPMALRAHATDRLYSKNPWRRFYVWARFFRRTCTKYICELMLQNARHSAQLIADLLDNADLLNVPAILIESRVAMRIDVMSLSEARNAIPPLVEAPELYADAYISYVYPDYVAESGEVLTDMESLADTVWDRVALVDVADANGARFKRKRLPSSPPLLLWLYLRCIEAYVVGNPLLTLDDYEVSPTAVNFNRSHATLSFMLWYLSMLVERGRIPAHYRNALLETKYGGPNAQTVNVIDDLSNGHILIRRRDANEMDVWPILARLPFAPRRLTEDPTTEPQFWESVLFLGEPVVSTGPRCLTCQSEDVQIREKNNHNMVFCSAECHTKYHSTRLPSLPNNFC